ncbi:ABC transporter permease [Qipengyuania sp. 483]
MNYGLQIAAVAKTSLQSMGHRWRLAASTVVGVALVVIVLLGFLAMSEGFRRTLEETGSDRVALLVSDGANAEPMSWVEPQQALLASELQGVRTDAGSPMISAEVYQGISLPDASGEEKTLGLRGMDTKGLAIRPGLDVIEGRPFAAGARELLVGEIAIAQHPQLAVGNTVAIAGAQWTVVGAFSAQSGLHGAEIWTDAQSLKDVYGTGTGYNAVRMALASGFTAADLQAAVKRDPRLTDLEVVGEDEFYSAQAQGIVKIIELIGWPIAIIMAVGAIAAAINTMYNSVEAQTREIATLRALGFGGMPVFIAVMAEAFVLVLVGGVIGAMAATALFQGLEGTTMSSSHSLMTFKFAVSGQSIVQAIVLATIVGLIGGLFPAMHAARKPILDGLKE